MCCNWSWKSFRSSQRPDPRIWKSSASLHTPKVPKAAKAMIDPATCQKLHRLWDSIWLNHNYLTALLTCTHWQNIPWGWRAALCCRISTNRAKPIVTRRPWGWGNTFLKCVASYNCHLSMRETKKTMCQHLCQDSQKELHLQWRLKEPLKYVESLKDIEAC